MIRALVLPTLLQAAAAWTKCKHTYCALERIGRRTRCGAAARSDCPKVYIYANLSSTYYDLAWRPAAAESCEAPFDVAARKAYHGAFQMRAAACGGFPDDVWGSVYDIAPCRIGLASSPKRSLGRHSASMSELVKGKRKAEAELPEPVDSTPPRADTGKRTSNPALQAKLDELFTFAARDEREAFVRAFVPLDLSDAELNTYLGDLTTGEEAEGAWENLAAEIETICSGEGVVKVEENGKKCVFYFPHPLIPNCDREVEFKRVGDEWRAEG